jgi:choline dehydrogenase
MTRAPDYLQKYWTREQVNCNHRKVYFPVARTMGGGSSVNSMMYVRGERKAYDRWSEQGAEGWHYEGVLPYFRKMEDFDGGENRYHGKGGAVGISGTRYKSRFGRAFVDACVEAGLKRNDDFSGAEQSGAGFYQFTQSNGVRSSTAIGHLQPAESRKNLRVFKRTEVDKVIFEGRRAVGVKCRTSKGEVIIRSSQEVILSAGAIGTPRILLLSGVGPADELKNLGIDPLIDLPGVGRGLQDHVRCPILYQPKKPVSLSVPAMAWQFFEWCVTRKGIFTSPTIAAGAFLQLSPESEFSDCQFAVKWSGSPPFRQAVDFQACLVDIESRGQVQLASADPSENPIVDPNYLSKPREVEILVSAIRFARSLASTKAFEEFGLLNEILPGRAVDSDAELADYVRNHIETCFHPAGTCRMGVDDLSVVDPELRVHALDGLRVVDASIMPSLINGNTNGPTIMIAEKAADLIRSE